MNPSDECTMRYDKEIFYLKSRKENYYERPTVMPPNKKGIFSAEPAGLAIDPKTGVINVNKSETGIRYTVTFTTHDDATFQTDVTIGGVDYKPGIYSLSSNEELTLKLFYNALIGHVPDKAEFDICPKGSGKRPASEEGLVIDPATGTIDLRKTVLEKQALGIDPANGKLPKNGTSKVFHVYYRIGDDQGLESLNDVLLRIHFFESKDHVPKYLRERINKREEYISRLPKKAMVALAVIVIGLIAALFSIPVWMPTTLMALASAFTLANTSGRDKEPRDEVIVAR